MDDAPEAQLSKPKELNAKTRQTSTGASALGRSDLTDNAFTETLPHIFQRHAGGRRAKIPTNELDLERGIDGNATADEGESPKAVPKTNIKLRWTMPKVDSRRLLQLDYDTVNLGVQGPYLQRRRVRWL